MFTGDYQVKGDVREIIRFCSYHEINHNPPDLVSREKPLSSIAVSSRFGFWGCCKEAEEYNMRGDSILEPDARIEFTLIDIKELKRDTRRNFSLYWTRYCLKGFFRALQFDYDLIKEKFFS